MINSNKVLLIFAGRHKRFFHMPLSLLPLAYWLKENGYEPIIYDQRVQPLQTLLDIIRQDILCIGISSLTGPQISDSIDLIKKIKLIKGVNCPPIVWGGVHASIYPEQTLRSEYVDHVIKGEGEMPLVTMLGYIKNDGTKNKIWHSKEQIDMNKLEYPFGLLEVSKYPNYKNNFPLETSRGCIHSCSFCYISQNRWHGMSANKVVDIVEDIKTKYNPNSIHFIDDNFFCNRVRVEKICNLLILRNINVKWETTCRADYVRKYSEDFLWKLRTSGCEELKIGAESGSAAVIDSIINKGYSHGDVINATRKLKRNKINATYSFIAGLPYETRADINASKRMYKYIRAIDKNAEINGMFLYYPYPGTKLFDNAIELGFKQSDTLEQWGDHRPSFSDTKHLVWHSKKHIKYIKSLSDIIRVLHVIHRAKHKYSAKELKERLGKYVVVYKLVAPVLKVVAEVCVVISPTVFGFLWSRLRKEIEDRYA